MQRPPEEPAGDQMDPVFVHSRHESVVIIAVWGICLLWTVVCYWLWGQNRAAEDVHTILGFPDWVFWSVVVPWVAVDIFTVWFCFFYMQDDDLGEVHEGADLAEQRANEHARSAPKHGSGELHSDGSAEAEGGPR